MGLIVVVKNPSDFVGAHLGHSEKNTKAILATTMGKVLVIDEVGGALLVFVCEFTNVALGVHAI
jgi:hypothetical protein